MEEKALQWHTAFQAALQIELLEEQKQYEEGKKMCEALKELFADELEEKLKRGVEIGKEQGIRALILDNIEEGISLERICEKLQKRFELTQEKAGEYIRKYTS